MAAPLLWNPYSKSPSFLGRIWNLHAMKRQGLVVFVGDPPGDSVSVPMDLLPVGVVFFPSLPSMGVMLFPSLPSMGVMLFPSFVLGHVSGEGDTLFVSLFLFSPLLPLSLLSSLSPSFSFSSPSHSPFLSHSFFLSFPLPSSSPFSVSLPLFSFPSSSLFHHFFLFLSLS